MNKNISILSITVIAVIGGFSLISSLNGENIVQNDEQLVQIMTGTLQNYSVEELSAGTPYAIIGKVTQITSVLVETEIGERVFSDITVKVKKDLNGKYQEKFITVRTLGGETDTIKTISHYSPSFNKNEKVLFFVAEKEPSSIYGDNYYVAGLSVGKYSLNEKETKAVKQSTGETEDLSDIVSKIQK